MDCRLEAGNDDPDLSRAAHPFFCAANLSTVIIRESG
jgi:hypothetical protein